MEEAQGQIAAFYAELKEKSGKRAAENLTAQGQYVAERDAAIQADSWDSVWSSSSPLALTFALSLSLSLTATFSFTPPPPPPPRLPLSRLPLPSPHLEPHLHPLLPSPTNRPGLRYGQPQGAGGPDVRHLPHALDPGAAQAQVNTQRHSDRASRGPEGVCGEGGEF